MKGEIKNLIMVWLSVITSICFCYFIVSKIPKGKLRLFSLLPILVLFTILPLYLSFSLLLLPTFITAGCITWLANFKLLLFAYDRGPLVSCDPPKSLLHFIFIACLPIEIKQNKKLSSSTRPPNFPLILTLPIKVLILAICVNVYDYKDHLHPKVMMLSYCCLVYLIMDMILFLLNPITRAMLRIELESPSDEPYLSTSLQDFWGRRWNLKVTSILRDTVYKPLTSSLQSVIGVKWAPLLAVFAVFLVSGLMHEFLFYIISRVSPTWEVTCFFVLHGVCVTGELVFKRLLTDKWQLHWAVSAPLTVGFVIVTATWLFLPPIVRSGTIFRAMEECKILINFVTETPKFVGEVLPIY
ncbi:MBOAT_2 domain-containing protein [Cephalotus follicularis]|uniref:MBOAT_2 domain-containing protein n=1 Tax=Cephalotus follicularis TaxID=3775 RepID=A0A1Q3D480_CEPFO|nr:MBOAT_2 domain-containing protein [Cephalotus follicularis]